MRRTLFLLVLAGVATFIGVRLMNQTNQTPPSPNVLLGMNQMQEMFAGDETVWMCADAVPSAKGISFSFTNPKTGKPAGEVLKESRTTTKYCVQYASPAQPQKIVVKATLGKDWRSYWLPILPQPPRP